MATPERLTACFSGRVQGVGFRFTTLDIAEDFPTITGFVRNLPDGRVQLVAEGSVEDLTAFLQAVQRRMGTYIRRTDTAMERATGEFPHFTIER